MCVDLRQVKGTVVIDKVLLPDIQELFSKLHDAKVLSTLDLNSAKPQLLLAEESCDLTAFITPGGLFRFMQVCFGLASAAAAFQKFMSSVLVGLP